MSTANALSGRYVVAGIGSTAFGKLGLDTVSLNAMACREALADAGICKEEVDALFLHNLASFNRIKACFCTLHLL